jgi:hypothetical protein
VLRYRPATADDARDLAGRLREDDRLAFEAVDDGDVTQTLLEGVAASDPCRAILDAQGRLLGIFGARPAPKQPEVGIVWMVAAPEIAQHPRDLVRDGRRWIARLHERYALLWNCADERASRHIRWLERCGFTMLRRHEHYGVQRRPFIEFASARATAED